MPRLRPFVILALGVLPWILVSCGTVSRVKGRTKAAIDKLGKSEEEGADEPAQPAPAWVRVGSVRLVRESLGFVLIERTGRIPPPRALLSVTRRGETVAELKVSPEAKTGFVIADVVSGSPKAGDTVMWAKTGEDPGAVPEMPPPNLERPSIEDLPPMEPLADPRILRPLSGVGGDPGAGRAPNVDDPEADLENELMSTEPEL